MTLSSKRSKLQRFSTNKISLSLLVILVRLQVWWQN